MVLADSQPLFWGLVLLCAAIVYWAPLPLAGLAAVGFVVLGFRDPLPALSLIVFSLPFYLLGRPVGHYSFSPTEVFIVLSSVSAAARLFFGGGLARSLADPLTVAFRRAAGDPVIAALAMLLVLAGVVSLSASIEVHQSLESLRTIVVEPVAFFFLVVTQVRRRSDVAVLAFALVLSGVAISLVGGWQYLTDERIITAEAGLRRIRGFYGSPNNLALFLGRAIPVSLAFALFWSRARLIWIVSASIMTAAMLLTFSVGGWVAVALAALVVAGLHSRRTLEVAAGVGVVLLLGGGVIGARIPRIASHFNFQSGTTFVRLDVWQSAVNMLAAHPIRGIGLDNFLYYYQHGYRLPTAWEDPNLSHPHNLILDFWLSLGIQGLVLLGVLLARFLHEVWLCWQTSSAEVRALFAGAVGAMVDIVAHGFVDNSFFLPDLAVLFWLMFAIVAVLRREQSSI